ncbi:MAG: hypothetical protein KFH87_05005 [Bacteroidetes bacterium]|nr:hypothetical protein [Bacteroidota bacterium]
MRFVLTLLIGLFAVTGYAQVAESEQVWIQDDFTQPSLSSDWNIVSGTWTAQDDRVRVTGGGEHMAMLYSRYILNTKPYFLETTIHGLSGGVVFNAEHPHALNNSQMVRLVDGGVSMGYFDFAGVLNEIRYVPLSDLTSPVTMRIYADRTTGTFSVLINERNVALEEMRFNSGYAGLITFSSGVSFDYIRVSGDGLMDIPAYFTKSNKRQLNDLSYMAKKDDGLLITNSRLGIVQRITSVGTYVSEITIEENTELRGVTADEQATYVVDAAHNSVRIFNLDDRPEKVITSEIDDPRDVAVDGNRVYVLDKNGIAVFDKQLAFIKRYCGGIFRDPRSFEVFGDRIIVGDFGNGQVQVLNKSDFSVEFVIKDEDLVSPWGVTVDPENGHIYVADPGAIAVLHYDQSGGFIERIDPITIRGFISPRDVLILKDIVYVADFDRILGFRKGVLSLRPYLRIDG